MKQSKDYKSIAQTLAALIFLMTALFLFRYADYFLENTYGTEYWLRVLMLWFTTLFFLWLGLLLAPIDETSTPKKSESIKDIF